MSASNAHTAPYAGASPRPFWLDRPIAPSPRPPLAGDSACDLAIVGGGFPGLWAGLQALEDDPPRDGVAPAAGVIASGAPGRDGGLLRPPLARGPQERLKRFRRPP